MSRKQTRYRKPVDRRQTCEGPQDAELEICPHSPLWKRALSRNGQSIEIRPDVYGEGSDVIIDLANAERVGHRALVDGVEVELITPLSQLEVS